MNARLYSGSWWQWFWKDFSHPSPITTTLGWNFVLYLWAYTLPPSVLCNIQRMLPILLPSFSLNLDLQELQVLPVFLLSPCSYVRACWVVTDSLRPKGLQPTRLLCPWNSPGKNSGVCCHFLLQGIFLTQGSNPCLLHWQVDSLPLSHLGGLLLHSYLQTNYWSYQLLFSHPIKTIIDSMVFPCS